MNTKAINRIDADGKTRSKTRTLEKSKIDNASGKLHESLPSWTFDGSSTGQVRSVLFYFSFQPIN